jgi:hypothetical protein
VDPQPVEAARLEAVADPDEVEAVQQPLALREHEGVDRGAQVGVQGRVVAETLGVEGVGQGGRRRGR